MPASMGSGHAGNIQLATFTNEKLRDWHTGVEGGDVHWQVSYR